jgi:methionyl-tRNA formyltransferase
VCGQVGGELLIQILPHYFDGSLKLQEQDHSKATICKFIEKSQGEIELPSTTDTEEITLDKINIIKRKYRALYPWPGIFFFHTHLDKNIRVKINKINLNADTLDTLIETLTPEGKHEMSWSDFQHGYLTK